MVSVIALFPVMLIQFVLNVLILRFADSSAVVALAVPQILVLLLTAGLLVLGVRLVMAVCLPFVDAVRTGRELTADDALKQLPQSWRSLPSGGGTMAGLVALFAPLFAGFVLVVALTVLVSGNELTIGMAFLEMSALLAVGVVLAPAPVVALLMDRLGIDQPRGLSTAPEVEAPVPAEPSNAAATSVAPPGMAASSPVVADETPPPGPAEESASTPEMVTQPEAAPEVEPEPEPDLPVTAPADMRLEPAAGDALAPKRDPLLERGPGPDPEPPPPPKPDRGSVPPPS
jgi:hypothetical protein